MELLGYTGVLEGTVQDIVGHERSTLTGSTYSGKSTFEMRREPSAKYERAGGEEETPCSDELLARKTGLRF